MQWLFDIVQGMIDAAIATVKAWVEAKGYLVTSFVDRGDPAAYDFDDTDFVHDSTWREKDLSTIVPEGTVAVLFKVFARHNNVGARFRIKTHGNANIAVRSSLRTVVSMADEEHDWICAVDADRKIDYYSTAVGWANLLLVVKGWWL